MQDLCLFAHFDNDNRVDNYVLWYLANLKELNFNILFISTSHLLDAELRRLRPYCSDVILRENSGLDFGSWTEGFRKYDSAVTGRLLLANDSVYGPIGDLRTALGRLTSKPADFYGMVESVQRAPHLQSWFLLFEPWVVQHPEFRAVMEQPFSSMTKNEIIAHGEIGLSRRLVNSGFCYRSIYSASQQGVAGRLYPLNPMHVLWREILFEESIPFLKIEALRDNPVGIEDAQQILQDVERLSPQVCNLIRPHLSRAIRRAKSPFLFPSYRRRINAAVQADYRFAHEKRWVASACNGIKLSTLMLPVWLFRFFKTTFGQD